MKVKNRYYILRHGKTEYQKGKANFTYPRKPIESVPLSDEGVEQIKRRAKQVKGLNIDKIYASDFLRTKQTAEIVKKEVGLGGDIIFDIRLRDLDLGIWHDKKKEDFYNKFPVGRSFFKKGPEGGESWDDLRERMIDVVREIDDRNKNKSILIVSHGDPLWILEGVFKDKSKTELIEEKRSKDGFIKTAELRRLN